MTASDTTAPVITGVNWALTSRVASYSVAATDIVCSDNVAVTGASIQIDDTTPPILANFGPIASYTMAMGPGAHVVSVWVRDAAGNISTRYDSDVLVDVVAPTAPAFVIPATSSTTLVTFTTAPSGSTDANGVTGYAVMADTATLPPLGAFSLPAPTAMEFGTSGEHTAYAYARDACGNISLATSDSVTISAVDSTAPTMTAFAAPDTSTSLVVTLTTPPAATDGVGVTGYAVTVDTATVPALGVFGATPTTVTVGADGMHTFRAYARDAAGNISAPMTDTCLVMVSHAATFELLSAAGSDYTCRWHYDFSTAAQLLDWEAISGVTLTHQPTGDGTGAFAISGGSGDVHGARWTRPVAVSSVTARCNPGAIPPQIFTNTSPTFDGASWQPNPGLGMVDSAGQYYIETNGTSTNGGSHTTATNAWYDYTFTITATTLTATRAGAGDSWDATGTFAPVQARRLILAGYSGDTAWSAATIEGVITL